jgi:cation transport ATPase
MSNKNNKRAAKHPPRAKNPSRTKRAPVKKERGGWLTAAIILVILHGFLMLGVIYGNNLLANEALPPTWFILSIVGAAIADIVAGIALWRWKKWGLTLYLVATVVVIALGVLATGYAMMWSFSRLIPFVIVGYIVRSKWEFFE